MAPRWTFQLLLVASTFLLSPALNDANVQGSHQLSHVARRYVRHQAPTSGKDIAAKPDEKQDVAKVGTIDYLLGVIILLCLVAQGVALSMASWVLSKEADSDKMKEVAGFIREGSWAYIRTMFGMIFTLLLPFSAAIFCFYYIQESTVKSLMITASFILGAVCSSISGVVGMWSSTSANERVAHTAVHGTFHETIVVALRSGAVAGLLVVSLAVLGIAVLFLLAKHLVEPNAAKVPVLLVGYSFGASFVGLFAQLGGGIFTKAADVGADLCGKIEKKLEEDDPRNPAVIADLVGDNVGDCCARGADLFESLAGELIAAMILGSTLATLGDLGPVVQTRYMLFPLVVHVIDLFVSTLGVMAVRPGSSEAGHENQQAQQEDPMSVLKIGYMVTVVLAAGSFVLTTYVLLDTKASAVAWWHYALCGLIGMVAGLLIVKITEYYTDFNYSPVERIAEQSKTGPGTNVIAGLGVGFESTMFPILVVCAAILSSYFLGTSTNIGKNDEVTRQAAGLFGTAVATMGMLSNLTYVLAMDVFGPITDNAAGIVEMGNPDERRARRTMDRLDAAGNTTKAVTKGFAVASAGLACFLLFRAFLDVVMEYSGIKTMPVIDSVQPEIFVAGLIGATTVFLFAGIAVQAVGDTAKRVVEEVRRQWQDGTKDGGKPIKDGGKPDYAQCVKIVSEASIQMMVKPGMLVVLMPILVGSGFRFLGEATNKTLLGAQCMTSYLVTSSIAAMLVALFLNNAGGAWDNAKKLVEQREEEPNEHGKGTETHKAAVVGDTVGDPCKDTAGPSLHVLMKLTATVTMVVGPVIAVPRH